MLPPVLKVLRVICSCPSAWPWAKQVPLANSILTARVTFVMTSFAQRRRRFASSCERDRKVTGPAGSGQLGGRGKLHIPWHHDQQSDAADLFEVHGP